jgi:hypothetical protein
MHLLGRNGLIKAILMAMMMLKLSEGFSPPILLQSPTTLVGILTRLYANQPNDIDCGCSKTLYSGKPSDDARTVDARSVIGDLPIFSVHGGSTSVNDQLGMHQCTSVVVFLRSLG